MSPTSHAPPRNAPGWYADPDGSGQRYWNGRSWMNLRRASRPSSSRPRDGGWVTLSGTWRSSAGY